MPQSTEHTDQISQKNRRDGGVFTIRSFGSMEEFHECVAFQHMIWGPGFLELAPITILRAAVRVGGVAAGAFSASNELLGFIFGISGVEAGRLVHWSDMLAVHPSHRNRGIGFELKLWQRNYLLELGISRVYWTFDPLQAKNARLNLGKLGAIAREYVVNMYGDTGSPLHGTLGSDRLIALWTLRSSRVSGRLDGSSRAPATSSQAVRALPTLIATDDSDPYPRPTATQVPPPSGRVCIPIPSEIDRMIRADGPLSEAWRNASRRVFLDCIKLGYEVRELIPGEHLSYYLLSTDED